MILDQKVRVFVRVARSGGFRRAARSLGLSQSAVSFHIDRLEEELGVKLFHRHGRSISLTAEGQVFFEELDELERSARRVENSLAFHSSVLGRRIRLGSNAVACPFTLPWVIHGFKKEHPDAVFTYKHVADEQDLLGDLESGDLDLGIVGHPVRHKKLQVHTCYESDVILVAVESYPHDRLTVAELPQVPLILENSDRGLELLLTQSLSAVGLAFKDLNIVIESDNVPLIKTFVQAGVGAAFLPRVALMDELDCGNFKVIPVESLTMKQSIYLVHPKSGFANPRTASFVEFVEKQLRTVVPGLDSTASHS